MVNNSEKFFSIEHSFRVNAMPMDIDTSLPTQQQFELSIPAPFRLASQLSYIDSQTLAPIRQIGGVAVELAEFLNLQAKKIDMMMGYILTVQDEEKFRHQGVKFGGSDLGYTSEQPLVINQLVTLKIFVAENNCAVFCIGRVIAVKSIDNNYLIEVEYALISDEDREQLVRTSLQVQTMLLKKRSDKRKKNNE